MSDAEPVVVLGATGYIGSALVARLARRGVRVRAVGRRAPAVGGPTVETGRADATAPLVLAELVDDAGAVVHLLAPLAPVRSWRSDGHAGQGDRVTVGPVRALVELLDRRSHRRKAPLAVVAAGTTAVVGCAGTVRVDGTEPDDPVTSYDAQKLAVEHVLVHGERVGAVRPVRLRLPTVYGTGSSPAAPPGTGVVATMVDRAVRGLPLTLWHDGSVVRDLLHVDDVAGAIDAALGHVDALGGRPWPLGTGTGVPLRTVADGIAERVARRTGRPPVPVVRIAPPAYAQPTDFHGVEVDASAFRRVTGWRPAVTLDEGLDGVVDAALDAARHGASADPSPHRREDAFQCES